MRVMETVGRGGAKRGDRAGHRAAPLDAFAADFELPEELEAPAPVEERGGSGRGDVRLLVARGEQVTHHRFAELPRLLRPGDVLVVNTSATLPAAVDGVVVESGEPVVVHFSTRQGPDEWVVELRTPDGRGSTRQRTTAGPVTVRLPDGSLLALRTAVDGEARRLWRAVLGSADPVGLLREFGRPIRYGYTDADRPLTAYQTVFADALAQVAGTPDTGSAEMPSAARPFTPELVTQLVSAGVLVVPITLHTGVASVESHEPPYAEWFEVPAATARVVTEARRAGARVVAVGTTAVRALESAAAPGGSVREARGWTELVITPERGVRAVDGLLTGLHEPRASHLLMLEAIAGRELLDASYAEALRARYLWHEFGDLHLVLRR